MPNEPYIAILVRDISDRLITQHEIVESTGISSGDLAAIISRRLRELEAVYDMHRYEVFFDEHDSIESVRNAYRELGAPDEKTVNLGPEYDERLRRVVGDVLTRMGIAPRGHDWGMAGSQELEVVELMSGLHRILLEAETYVGLTLTGPAKLADRVNALVAREMAKPAS